MISPESYYEFEVKGKSAAWPFWNTYRLCIGWNLIRKIMRSVPGGVEQALQGTVLFMGDFLDRDAKG